MIKTDDFIKSINEIFSLLQSKATDQSKKAIKEYWQSTKTKAIPQIKTIIFKIYDISASEKEKEKFGVIKEKLNQFLEEIYILQEKIETQKIDNTMLEKYAIDIYNKAVSLGKEANVFLKSKPSQVNSSQRGFTKGLEVPENAENVNIELEYNTKGYTEYFIAVFEKLGQDIIKWESSIDPEKLEGVLGKYLLFLREQRYEITALMSIIEYLGGKGLKKLFTRKTKGAGENISSLISILNDVYNTKFNTLKGFILGLTKGAVNTEDNAENKEINPARAKDFFQGLYMSLIGVLDYSYTDISEIILNLKNSTTDDILNNHQLLEKFKKFAEQIEKIKTNTKTKQGNRQEEPGLLEVYIDSIASGNGNLPINFIYTAAELEGIGEGGDNNVRIVAINSIASIFNYIVGTNIFGKGGQISNTLAKKIIFLINTFGNKGEKLYNAIINVYKQGIYGYENILKKLSTSNLNTLNKQRETFSKLENTLLLLKNILPPNYKALIKSSKILQSDTLLKNVVNSLGLFKTLHHNVFNALLDASVKTAVICKITYPLKGLGKLVNGVTALPDAINEIQTDVATLSDTYSVNEEIIPELQDAFKTGTILGKTGLEALSSNILDKYKKQLPLAFKDLLGENIDTSLLDDLGDNDIRTLVEKKLKDYGKGNASEVLKERANKYDEFKTNLIWDENGDSKYGYFSRKVLSAYYDVYGIFMYLIKLLKDILEYLANISNNLLFLRAGLILLFATLFLGIIINDNIYLYFLNTHFFRLDIPYIPIQPTGTFSYLLSVGYVLGWFVMALLIILNISFNKFPKLLISILTQDRDTSRIFFSLLYQLMYILILYLLFKFFLWS